MKFVLFVLPLILNLLTSIWARLPVGGSERWRQSAAERPRKWLAIRVAWPALVALGLFGAVALEPIIVNDAGLRWFALLALPLPAYAAAVAFVPLHAIRSGPRVVLALVALALMGGAFTTAAIAYNEFHGFDLLWLALFGINAALAAKL